jgi:hypothetical protein
MNALPRLVVHMLFGTNIARLNITAAQSGLPDGA